MPPISIQLYTVREQTKDGNHLAILKQIADIGYDAVEGFGFGMTPEEFKGVVNDLGMVVSSYFGPLPEPDNVNELIDTTLRLGTKHNVSGFWIPSFETVDAIAETADKLNEVLPAFEKAGVTFSLHNHWFEFETIDGKLKIDYLIERCPKLQLELDIYWASNFAANRSEEMVAKYRDRIHLLHIKDGPLVRDEPMTAAGGGKVDVRACLQAADPAKLDWAIVELDEFAGDMMDAVADSHLYLRGLASL